MIRNALTWALEDDHASEKLKSNLHEFKTELGKLYNQTKRVRWIDIANELVPREDKWFSAREDVEKREIP